ncbi:MAG: LysM peptidoglycan-binding domain-containing protein [Proteobacteria bacterium]|nr:LysM peptidoglycan-binding domain-containing protein [Pseudomonadota bacterium]MYJ94515.1 LysM peptidoglycan-binding domain-containing protein [Pseudomonadota bacterium]
MAASPPPYRESAVRHVIARGDTLSEIALQYNVSLSALNRFNGLSSDTIRIGQVLTLSVC